MSISKSCAVVTSIVGVVGFGAVVHRTLETYSPVVPSHLSPEICAETSPSIDDPCSCGHFSGERPLGLGDETSLIFEGDTPACTACTHEPNVVLDGDGNPGAISDTGDSVMDSRDKFIITITEVSLAKHINPESGTVIVDFYADWCGPCKLQGAILADFARANPDVTVVKVNVDESPELAAKFDIKGIPALKIFRADVLKAEHVGVANAESLAELLSRK